MNAKLLVIALVLSVASIATAAGVDEGAGQDAQVAKQLPSYPLTTCVVSGEPLEEPIDVVQDGTLVRLCCKGCTKMLAKKPEAVVAKVHAAVVERQKPGYPLEKCVVSGEPLGAMGEPADVVVGTRLVRLCCGGCEKGAKKDVAGVMAQIDAALIEKQLPDYPLETCVVSGEPLEEPIDLLHGTRLVRICCKGCKKPLAEHPEKLLAKLDAAAAEKTEKAEAQAK